MSIEKTRRYSSPQHPPSPDAASPEPKTELLIRDMSIELDNHEEREDDLQNERLPGSCKSFYALKFRLQTDKDNANFAQVSLDLQLWLIICFTFVHDRGKKKC